MPEAIRGTADYEHRPSMMTDIGRRVRSRTLSAALRARFELAVDPAGLAQSITMAERSVVAVPTGHPLLTTRLFRLGLALAAHAEHAGDPADVEITLVLRAGAVDPAHR
ncbi:hypothetical protein [Frankia tisae]|uniref:hypothetical protein n=1 Tax=Frankia tisae TaxID=2950104 RepID=UPI0021C17900|nr:hypothetical protein [Frankia tisae]